MRSGLMVLWIVCCWVTSAMAQVSVSIGLPGASIGISMPAYPTLVAVPGYPVYYDPRANSNFFFYDGMYWVYQRDSWYASSWYNGPWWLMSPETVPYFVLRIPVRYYRRPPAYFRGWASNAAPRWGEHWGDTWAQSRPGWDNWDRNSVPAPAPLPTYQRQFSGNKYPRVEQQQAIRGQHYRYQPHEAVVQQHEQVQQAQSPPAVAPKVTPAAAPDSNPRPQQAGSRRQVQPPHEAVTLQKAPQPKQIRQEAAPPQKVPQQPQRQQEQKQQQPQPQRPQPQLRQQQDAPREQTAKRQGPERPAPERQAPERQAPERQAPERSEHQGGERGR